MQSKSIIYAVVVSTGLIRGIMHADEDINQGHSYSEPGVNTRQITFTSKLTDEKKAYTLYVGSYKPSKFKLKINGHKIKDGQSITLAIEDNKFLARYDYEFRAMFQHFAGYREAGFEADPNRDHYDIDFSWKSDDRFIIRHARYLGITQTCNDHEKLDKRAIKSGLEMAMRRLR